MAVVGTSNWSLNAAKMNRAIHLSRPEPTKEDLCETGYSLHYADHEAQDLVNSQHLSKTELQCLAEAYFEYQNLQTHANFRGLRDYYALIKRCGDFQEVNISLQRNFGGLPGEVTNIQKFFLDTLKKLMIFSTQLRCCPGHQVDTSKSSRPSCSTPDADYKRRFCHWYCEAKF